MRSDRLLSILLLLQAHGRLSARDLAGRLETSVRTIHRDIDALSQAGVPVFTERGRKGGTAILPGYSTDMTGLTPAEAEAIFVAAGQGALADLGLEEELRLGLRKLMAALPERQRPDTQRARERVIVESGRWLRQPEPTPWLEVVRRAVLDERRLAMAYRSSSASVARMQAVDPYGLVAKAGTWYLIAAPIDGPGAGESRLYRVSRVETAEMLPEAVVRPSTLDVATEWARLRRRFEDRGAGISVRLRVRDHRLDLLLRMTAPQIVGAAVVADAAETAEPAVVETAAWAELVAEAASAKLTTDGAAAETAEELIADQDPTALKSCWREVTLPFVALGAAEAVLLGFGADLEVLDPTELRDAMARTAAAIVALYGS